MKLSVQTLLFCTTLLVFAACGGAEDTTESTPEKESFRTPASDSTALSEDEEPEIPEMQIMALEEWPNEIEECSCGLSIGKEQYESFEYIYADDLMEHAYMMVDSVRIEFSAVSSPGEDGQEELGSRWNSENYILKLDLVDEPHDGESEGTYQTGTLILEHILSGAQRKLSVYGFCGC